MTRSYQNRNAHVDDLHEESIETGSQALTRIFQRMEEGKLTQQEGWELANKVYDRDLIKLHEAVGDYSRQWKLTTRLTQKSIQQEEENLDFLFNDYLSLEDW